LWPAPAHRRRRRFEALFQRRKRVRSFPAQRHSLRRLPRIERIASEIPFGSWPYVFPFCAKPMWKYSAFSVGFQAGHLGDSMRPMPGQKQYAFLVRRLRDADDLWPLMDRRDFRRWPGNSKRKPPGRQRKKHPCEVPSNDLYYTLTTFFACGPRSVSSTSKLTLSPSARVL
jgi:hypothetical protein